LVGLIISGVAVKRGKRRRAGFSFQRWSLRQRAEEIHALFGEKLAAEVSINEGPIGQAEREKE